tara:strand:+ start:8157 stop:9077 length:921 start_codon:yes stop_codon:yes gene_type:complete
MKKNRLYISISYRLRLIKKLFRKSYNFLVPFENYGIIHEFGRLGNNLQQIALATLYVNKFSKNFYFNDTTYIKSIEIINNNKSDKYKNIIKKYEFYSYDMKQSFRSDFPLNEISSEFINTNMQKAFIEIIKPNLKFLRQIKIPDNTLVLHIRSGDIFEKDKYPEYVQNPIGYYLDILKKYESTIIVTDKSRNNPVIPKLLELSNVSIKSGDIDEDFNTLFSAKNLATSGVGTFPIAAALISTELENFYYSDLYLSNHLNPRMIKNKKVKHHEYSFNNYIEVGSWNNSKENLQMMMSKEIDINYPDT